MIDKTNDSFDEKKIEGLVDDFINSEDVYVKDTKLDKLTEELFDPSLTLEQQKIAKEILEKHSLGYILDSF